jgi:hypothetical protein
MQSQNQNNDFVLYPSQPDKRSVMLALESSRPQQHFFQQYTMDSSFVDPFGIGMDNLNTYGHSHDASRLPHSYFETPAMYAEAGPDLSNAEQHIPSLSSASGPSIASASSSAIGSPYSGTTHNFHETWVDTNHGLGLQAAMATDLFPHDYMGSTVETESTFYPDKLSNNFVGESKSISSDVKSESLFPTAASCLFESSSSTLQTSSSLEEHHIVSKGTPTQATSVVACMNSQGSPVPPILSPAENVVSPSPDVPRFKSPISPASTRRRSTKPYSPVLGRPHRAHAQSIGTLGRIVKRSPSIFPRTFNSSLPSSPSLANISTLHSFQNSFFNQSSGNFLPPLESSCWFSLNNPCQCLFELFLFSCYFTSLCSFYYALFLLPYMKSDFQKSHADLFFVWFTRSFLDPAHATSTQLLPGCDILLRAAQLLDDPIQLCTPISNRLSLAHHRNSSCRELAVVATAAYHSIPNFFSFPTTFWAQLTLSFDIRPQVFHIFY